MHVDYRCPQFDDIIVGLETLMSVGFVFKHSAPKEGQKLLYRVLQLLLIIHYPYVYESMFLFYYTV